MNHNRIKDKNSNSYEQLDEISSYLQGAYEKRQKSKFINKSSSRTIYNPVATTSSNIINHNPCTSVQSKTNDFFSIKNVAIEKETQLVNKATQINDGTNKSCDTEKNKDETKTDNVDRSVAAMKRFFEEKHASLNRSVDSQDSKNRLALNSKHSKNQLDHKISNHSTSKKNRSKQQLFDSDLRNELLSSSRLIDSFADLLEVHTNNVETVEEFKKLQINSNEKTIKKTKSKIKQKETLLKKTSITNKKAKKYRREKTRNRSTSSEETELLRTITPISSSTSIHSMDNTNNSNNINNNNQGLAESLSLSSAESVLLTDFTLYKSLQNENSFKIARKGQIPKIDRPQETEPLKIQKSSNETKANKLENKKNVSLTDVKKVLENKPDSIKKIQKILAKPLKNKSKYLNSNNNNNSNNTDNDDDGNDETMMSYNSQKLKSKISEFSDIGDDHDVDGFKQKPDEKKPIRLNSYELNELKKSHNNKKSSRNICVDLFSFFRCFKSSDF